MHPGIQNALPGSCRETAGISVENINFSTLSTGFSTRVFPQGIPAAVCNLVYINYFEGKNFFRLFLPFITLPKGKNRDEKKDLTRHKKDDIIVNCLIIA